MLFNLVPTGTIGAREMVNRVFEKITGEELVVPVERLEHSEFEDMVLLPGYSLKGDLEEISQALLNAYEILCEALQKGKLALEVEDDTGKRYAIPACNFATNDGLNTIVTGTFISPGRGDKQQTVCFADREKFSEWLASRFPDDTEETRTAPAVSPTSFPRGKVTKWYNKRAANWMAGDPIPSEENDLTDAKAKFGDRVTRAFIRELRPKLAPAAWNITTTGPKPKTPSK